MYYILTLEIIKKGPSFCQLFGDFLGFDIFDSDGDQWKVHRKIASNMFSRNLLRRTAEIAVQVQKLHLVDLVAEILQS